jgi:hypothetical protein
MELHDPTKQQIQVVNLIYLRRLILTLSALSVISLTDNAGVLARQRHDEDSSCRAGIYRGRSFCFQRLSQFASALPPENRAPAFPAKPRFVTILFPATVSSSAGMGVQIETTVDSTRSHSGVQHSFQDRIASMASVHRMPARSVQATRSLNLNFHSSPRTKPPLVSPLNVITCVARFKLRREPRSCVANYSS